ncbi:MAG: SBBP repeat-containing protein [Ignavibacteria bacterium]
MKTIIFIFLIALTVVCRSQIIQEQSYVQQVWKEEFGGEELMDMVTDNAGNVYITGSVSDLNYDWVTIKYSPTGERLWFTDFSGNHADIPHAIAVDNLGNVYVTGESYYLTSDFYTVKYNSAGVEQWANRYGGPGNDIAYSIALDENRNVYVTGGDMNSYGNLDCVTLKYTPGGTLVWEKKYESPNNGNDKGTSVAVDIYGSIYVAGRTENPGTGYDYLVLKYNSSGVQQWVRTYDGLGHGSDMIRKMVLTSNAVYVTGYSDGEGTGKDYLTIKYNLTGGLYYAKRYNGPSNDEDRGESLVVDNTGNAYVTGYSKSNTGFDYATVKYNSMGALQWLNREDGVNHTDDYARDIAIDGDGDIYVTGEFKKADDDYQLATVKYSSSGTQKWLKKLYYPGKTSEGRKIIVDASENIYIGGMTDLPGTQHGFYNEFLVVKYIQSPYLIQSRIEMPSTFSLSQNFPNPFNPVTKISFSIPNNSYTKLVVFDISGKQVAELVDNELDAGTYNIDFDGSSLASGTYFYRITSGDFTDVRKMVLVK